MTDIPEFNGESDPKVCIEWLTLMEHVFVYKNIPDDRRVRLMATRFRGYASTWWADFIQQRLSGGLNLVNTWRDMKDAMTTKFIPLNFHRDILYKLQNFRQDSRTVDY